METPLDQLIATLRREGLHLADILAADLSREIPNEDYDPETQDEDFRYFDEALTLRVGYGDADLAVFIMQLDRRDLPDDTMLFGTIWLTDRRWIRREEYDGWAPRWEFHACPPLTERVK